MYNATEEGAADEHHVGSGQAVPSPRETIERINHDLVVEGFIWDRDSHGLFDYESKCLLERQLSASGCFILARDEASLKSVMPKLDTPDSYKMLLSSVYKNGAYWIYHNQSLYKQDGELNEEFSHFDQVWQVVRLQNQRVRKLTTV